MARRIQTIDIPIVFGERQDVDPKMLPLGAVARVQNMRLRKDGRWGVRNDYTALSMSTPYDDDLRATDLVVHDGRLLAIGEAQAASAAVPNDLFEFVNIGSYNWKPTDDVADGLRLNPVLYAHNGGRTPTRGFLTDRVDCAAAGGLVCLAAAGGNSSTLVHIYRPDTDATVLTESIGNSRPRVIAVGNTFFITARSASDEIKLHRFNPATDSGLVQLTDAFATGDTILAYDVAANQAGDGFWVAVLRDTPTTTIRPFDSSGAAGTDVTGPTTAFTAISIVELDSGETEQLQLVAVHSADGTVNAYGYDSGGTLQTGPTELLSGRTTTKQVAVGIGPGRTTFNVVAQTSDPNLAIEYGIDPDHTGGTETTWFNATLQSKLALVDDGTETGVPIFGGAFVEAGNNQRTNFLGIPTQQFVAVVKDHLIGNDVTLLFLPTIALDASTGTYYWPNLYRDADGRSNVQVTQLRVGTDERRQGASLGGQLHLSGGAPQVFDSRCLVESGFFSRPRIENVVSSSGAGSLTPETIILIAACFEWQDSQGNLHLSPISEVETVTLGAGEDTIDLDVVGPFSLRDNVTSDVVASSVKIIVFRSESNRVILKRAADEDVLGFGRSVSFTLTGADSTIAEEPPIYTQAGRGALGDILEHESPRPARYLWRAGDRLVYGGLPDPYQIQVSKALFPGEPVEASEDLGFFVSVPERVRGVAALDNAVFVFSRDSVFAFPAVGPDDAGTDDIPPPQRLPSSTGLKDARSLIDTPLGIAFQGDDDKLWLLPRGGGAPQSFGDAVEDTLAAFPDVVGACVSREEQLVMFACANSGGTDSRIVAYDLRSQVWSVDEFEAAEPVTALSVYQGRPAYLSEGVVLLEDSDAVPNAFISHGMTTGTIRPFQDNAWGRLHWALWLCEFRGNCTATARISYDDGVTWTTIKAFSLSTAEYSAGDTVRLQAYPARIKGDRFTLQLNVTDLASAATEGLVINELTIGVTGETGGPRAGRTR